MDAIISAITNFIINGISLFGYVGIGIMMAIESACIPLPSEIIMPFAGFLVSQGRFSLWGCAFAGAFGCVVGSILAYIVGYYSGRAVIEKYGKYILISKHDMEIADKFFNKYGSIAIFLSRLMPVIRTFISLPAGIAKMNFIKFIVYTFLGSLPWCFGLAYVGKKLGDHWDILGVYFHKFDILIVLIILVMITWHIKRYFTFNVKK
ncbi:MAG: DedA family protein [Candidatus Kuenenbacteria bacterium]